MAATKQSVFVRDATGLVRAFRWYDALILSLAVTGPTYFGIASQIGYVSPNVPGADFTTSAAIGLLFMIPLGIVYYLFAVSMPRSGGDYVWIGRAIHPILGFVSGWGMFASFIFLLAGVGALTWASVVVPVFFVTMGYAWHSAGLVTYATSFTSGSATVFGYSVLVLVLGALITAFGPKVYSRIMIVLAAIIFLGTFIFIGISATTSPSTFANAFNTFTSTNGLNATYNSIITNAGTGGWTYQPVTTALTLASIPFGVLLFNGFNYSVYVSGEMKDVRRSMLWGVLLALLICGILDIIGLYFGVKMIGYEFNQAAFFLFGKGSSAWPFPGVSPWIALFTPMVINNAYISTFVQLGWLLFFIWWAAALILAISRYIFAFSFDRVLPTAFADINQRFHFPLKATILTLAIGALFLVDFNFYNTYLLATLNTTAIWAVVWVIVGLSAIVFAFRKKEMAKALPGGPSLLIVFGLLSMIAMSITFYYAATNAAIGPFTGAAQGLLGVVFASGLVIYVISYYYHKGKNINLDMVLKEIPPE